MPALAGFEVGNAFGQASGFDEKQAQSVVCLGVIRFKTEGRLELCDGFGNSARDPGKRHGEVHVKWFGVGLDAQGGFEMLHRGLNKIGPGEDDAEIAVRLGVIRATAKGCFKMIHGFGAAVGKSHQILPEIAFREPVSAGDIDGVLKQRAAVLPVAGLFPGDGEAQDAGQELRWQRERVGFGVICGRYPTATRRP